jgi:hypothetical protein
MAPGHVTLTERSTLASIRAASHRLSHTATGVALVARAHADGVLSRPSATQNDFTFNA